MNWDQFDLNRWYSRSPGCWHEQTNIRLHLRKLMSWRGTSDRCAVHCGYRGPNHAAVVVLSPRLRNDASGLWTQTLRTDQCMRGAHVVFCGCVCFMCVCQSGVLLSWVSRVGRLWFHDAARRRCYQEIKWKHSTNRRDDIRFINFYQIIIILLVICWAATIIDRSVDCFWPFSSKMSNSLFPVWVFFVFRTNKTTCEEAAFPSFHFRRQNNESRK